MLHVALPRQRGHTSCVVSREVRMVRKLSKLILSSCLAGFGALALSISPAVSAPIAAAKGLRADDSQLVQVRAARGGRRATAHRGTAHRGGTAYRGGAVVRRGAVVTGGSYGTAYCDPTYQDCGTGYSGGAVVRGGRGGRGGTGVRGGAAVRRGGGGARVAHRGAGRGR